MTNNLTSYLERLGLTPKETSIYLSLLSLGARATSIVAKRAGLNRGTTYTLLHNLLQKGLVQKITKGKIQIFSAVDPHQLISYVERREAEMHILKNDLRNILPLFESLRNPRFMPPKIEFFEGVEGARNVLQRALTSKNKTIRAFLSLVDILNYVGIDFFSKFTANRIAYGYTVYAISGKRTDHEARERYEVAKRFGPSKKERRYIRYVGEELTFPVTMYLFDDKIGIISSNNEGFSMLIQSAELATMQNKIFELLWGMSTVKK